MMRESDEVRMLREIRDEVRDLRKELNAWAVRRPRIWNALLRGMVQGFGTVMGATVVVSIFAYLLSTLDFIPILGDWMRLLEEEMRRKGGG